jgi:hypothetical protein
MKTKKLSFIMKIIPVILIAVLLIFNQAISQDNSVKLFLDGAKSADSLLSLSVAGNGYSDQTLVYFYYPATVGFDSEYDAYKLPGIYAAPQLFSIIECCNLAVNVLPTFSTNYIVQLGFSVGADTDYTITADGIDTFDPSTTVYLLDSRDNVLVNLNTTPIYTFNATPDDCIQRFKLYFDLTSKFVALNAFLEGPFNGADMNSNLQSNGIIPLNQPYNVFPWNYSGSESVSSVPANVVDWVLVELRDAANAASASPATMVSRQAAFLMNDGSIKYTDACANLDFNVTLSQGMFIVIHHRNHLDIMSATALTKTDGVYQYNFSSGVNQVFGGDLAHSELTTGVWGMISGDGNGDGEVDNVDKDDIWVPEESSIGYLSGDYDLSGAVNNVDLNLWDTNSGKGSGVPD